MFDSAVGEREDIGGYAADDAAYRDALIAPWGLAAEQIAAELPGADLAYLLDQADLERADDHSLVEVVAAWQRLVAWASAGAARAAAALAARPSMNPTWPREVSEPNVCGEELAMRLGCSRRQARLLVREGVAFQGALAPTGDALGRGEIDPAKARAIVGALDDAPVRLALAVQRAVLPGAACRTPSQLARDLSRALITRDPRGARARHQVAVRARRVDRPKTLPDGMAGLWAVLPATGAARLDSALDSLARGAQSAGDPRALDQLRADLLVGLTAGDVPGSVARVALGGTSSGTEECWPPFPGTARRTEIRVTVPLSTLIGLDDGPAELAGYGPITAEAARALARGGTWRRLVTDPMSGRVLDVGRTRYRPPADLVEHVRARDGTCARPGCSATAESCDLDHTVEFHRDGGQTRHDSLGPLCRRDHLVKTDGGFRLQQVAPGVFAWLTPTGHRYRVVPGDDAPYERVEEPRERDPEPPPF